MVRVIKRDRSVIPACDVKDMQSFRRVIRQTYDVEGIGAYKVGSVLTIRYGLPALIRAVRKFTDLPVIYDHQKAMTDTHDLGKDFAAVVKEAGASALIGFPQSGPVTEEAWIKACKDIELEVIVGGEMTHPKYKKSEGGISLTKLWMKCICWLQDRESITLLFQETKQKELRIIGQSYDP